MRSVLWSQAPPPTASAQSHRCSSEHPSGNGRHSWVPLGGPASGIPQHVHCERQYCAGPQVSLPHGTLPVPTSSAGLASAEPESPTEPESSRIPESLRPTSAVPTPVSVRGVASPPPHPPKETNVTAIQLSRCVFMISLPCKAHARESRRLPRKEWRTPAQSPPVLDRECTERLSASRIDRGLSHRSICWIRRSPSIKTTVSR